MKTATIAPENENCKSDYCLEVENGVVVGDQVKEGNSIFVLVEHVSANFWGAEYLRPALDLSAPKPVAGKESYIGDDGEIHFRKVRKPAKRTKSSKIMGGGYYD